MALFEINGFDVDDTPQRFTYAHPSAVSLDASNTRFGVGRAFGFSGFASGPTMLTKDFAGRSTVIIGFAFRTAELGTGGAALIECRGDSGVTLHGNVRVLANGAVALYRGTNLLTTSSPGIISINTWHYLEFKHRISDTTGLITLRVDEVVQATFAGDTKNAGTSLLTDRFSINNLTTQSRAIVDDLYICDDTGATHNDFLGDLRVQTLMPVGPGSNTGLLPVGSSANWENVDETVFNVTDYNYSVTPGAKDTYAMANLASGTSQVLAVQVVDLASKTDSGSRSAKTVLRSGGTDYASAAKPLSATPQPLTEIYTTDPATSAAWTLANVDAIEAGIEVV